MVDVEVNHPALHNAKAQSPDIASRWSLYKLTDRSEVLQYLADPDLLVLLLEAVQAFSFGDVV